MFPWLVIAEFTSQVRRPPFVFRWMALSSILCVAAGCRLTTDAGYSSPSYAEQNEAILEVVAYGATREQAVNALRENGVQGSFGVSESVYYCDVWERHDGGRWHLDIALFFDQSGRLYKVGPSQPDIGAATGTALTPADSSDDAARETAGQSRPLPLSRSGRRTPFADSLE